MIRLVIFDWSGVISDDTERAYRKTVAVLESYNQPGMSLEEWRRSFYIPWIKWYADHGVKVPVQEIRARFKQVEQHYDQTAKAFPGVKGVIDSLRERGIKTAVLSTSQTHLVALDAKAFDLEESFDLWETQIIDKRDTINSIIERMKVEKEEVLYVGDMVHDIETARFAGVKSVACTFGYTPEDLLLKEKPDYVIKKITELLDLDELKGWR